MCYASVCLVALNLEVSASLFMRLGRSPLQNPPRGVCRSKAFLFIRLRTLLCNGAQTTPLQSITSALFSMQWGSGGGHFSSESRGPLQGYSFTAKDCKFAPLFSITSRMVLSQSFSFHAFALLPGDGWVPRPYRDRGVKVILELPPQRIEGEKRASRNLFEWVLPDLQLRTYDLRLFGENHRGAASQAKRARGIPFVHANLDEPARSHIRERFRSIPLRERFHKPAHRLRPNLQLDRAILGSALRQIFQPEIRNQISERIRTQNHSLDHS